jgi:hypothetical protein
MLYSEIIDVYTKIHTKHKYTVCRIVECTYSNLKVLKD